MSHVGDRMAILRFQSNRPYSWRSGGCGCGCGGNYSIFNQYNMGPMMSPRPFGFGFGGGLFRAGFITNLVFGCLDYGMNWVGQILGWCGIGGGGGAQPPVQEQPKKEGEVSDFDALKQVFKDAKLVRKIGDNEYEVVDGDKRYVGSYDKIMEDSGKTQVDNTTKSKQNISQPGAQKTEDEKAQIKTQTDTAIEEAKTQDKVKLPANCTQIGAPEVTVADDGKVTITIKYKEGGQEKTLTANGDDAQKAAESLVAKCQELNKKAAEDELAKIEKPEGCEIEAAGANKDGKTQPTYILKKGNEEPQYFDNIDDLKEAIKPQNVEAEPGNNDVNAGNKKVQGGKTSGNKNFAQIAQKAEAKLNEALTAESNKLTLPKNYSKTEITVANDGTLSVGLKTGNKEPVMVTGKNAKELIENLKTKSGEITHSQQLATIRDNPKLNSRISFENGTIRYTDRFGNPHTKIATEETINEAISACEDPKKPKNYGWKAECDSYTSSDQNFISRTGKRYEINFGGDWSNTDKFDVHLQHGSGRKSVKYKGDNKEGFIAINNDDGGLFKGKDTHGETKYKDKFPTKVDAYGNIYVQTQENGQYILIEDFLNESTT